MARRFSRSSESAAAPHVSRPMLTARELAALRTLQGLQGGELGATFEDIEVPARRLLRTAFGRAVGGAEYEVLQVDWAAALVQAARLERLYCSCHWGSLPVCLLDPFEGLREGGTVRCPMEEHCRPSQVYDF